MDEQTLTVRQLRKQLAALPNDQQDYEVITEGCDCYGDAASVQADVNTRQVLILRPDSRYEGF